MVSLRVAAVTLAALVSLLTGCSGGSENQRVIATAYAGPMSLTLHKEISPKSGPAAVVKHGEKLDVLGRRRRFVKVRTASGAVGWTDLNKVIASEQMAELDKLAETAKRLPSHGEASVFEHLNVHTEPNRQSPSFYQIKEGELVNVVLHRTAPRTEFRPKSIFPPAPKPEPVKGKTKREPKYPPPPMPAAPQPPPNWLELSKRNLPPEMLEPAEPPKPVPLDDWSLVRLSNGRAGWVLTGMLRMHIPDEVAQYSEGQRITAYFPMAEVKDQSGQTRHHWLWTTLSKVKQPYQFDGFRYFIWNTRRNRYETAYIERDVTGYFPVEIGPVQMTVGKKNETFPGFALIVEDKDGTRVRKQYAFQYYRVVLVDKRIVEPEAEGEEVSPGIHLPPEPPAHEKKSGGWLAQIKGLKRKFFGGQ